MNRCKITDNHSRLSILKKITRLEYLLGKELINKEHIARYSTKALLTIYETAEKMLVVEIGLEDDIRLCSYLDRREGQWTVT